MALAPCRASLARMDTRVTRKRPAKDSARRTLDRGTWAESLVVHRACHLHSPHPSTSCTDGAPAARTVMQLAPKRVRAVPVSDHPSGPERAIGAPFTLTWASSG